MGNISPADSIENIVKAATFSENLKSKQFYKNFKENTFSNSQVKLKDFVRRLVKKINEFFNPIAAKIEH